MTDRNSRLNRLIIILWPSFLTAGVATVVFFTALDPVEFLAHTRLAEISRLGVYTIGFFLFWVLTAVTSVLTCYFQRPPDTVNRRAPKTASRG